MKTTLLITTLLLGAVYVNAQCFEQAVNFPADSGTRSITSADFNNDGFADIATVNFYVDSVAVALNNGDGTFATPINHFTGNHLVWASLLVFTLASNDIDGDGNIDIIVGITAAVGVLMGNGDGTFDPAVTYLVDESFALFTIADFNNDGYIDIATANDNSNSITVLLGNSNNGFNAPNNFAAGYKPYSITHGHFNNDNNMDLAVASEVSEEVTILIGNGNGTFTATNTYPVGHDPYDITSGDFNGDGFSDLAVANHGTIYADLSTISVLLCNGNGTFVAAVNYEVGRSGAYSIIDTDINGDGIIDLAIGNEFYDHVSIYIGNSNGTFADSINFPVDRDPWALAANDFNNDGFMDVATANYTMDNVSVLLQRCSCGEISSTPAACQNSGSASVQMLSGTAPFSYNWNTGGTNDTITNIPAGIYNVTITDNSGCQLILTDTIIHGSITVDSSIVNDATCALSSDGSATFFPSGLNGPFTFQWSTSDTTQTISGLTSGTYSVTISDAVGCVWTQPVTIDEAGLLVNINVLATAGGCANPNDGVLAAVPNNGNAPYTYYWSNGETTDTISNLLVGGYSLTTTDGSGCENVRHAFVPTDQTCYSVLSGRVYYDADSNCVDSLSDLGYKHRMVVLQPGAYYAYTNAAGEWSAAVPLGSYTITTLGNDLVPTCRIDSLAVTASSNLPITDLNLPRLTLNAPDVSTTIFCGIARPGFLEEISVMISNNGFLAEDVSGVITIDGAITTMPALRLPPGVVVDSISSSSPFNIFFRYSSLAPQSILSINISVDLPTIPIVSLGQILTHSASVSLQNGTDQVLQNNEYVCETEVTGAYDPNDKQVFSNGVNVDGIAAIDDTILKYIVRFQNTGTDTAFNVLIIDTLDVGLDAARFNLIATSHPVQVEILKEGIMHFIFDNILLPDSNINEPASHGFIEFQIALADPTVLEPISNQAAIYFDFNPPIFTNTVSTERTMVGIAETELVPVHVFPNPTTGQLSVNLGGRQIAHIELYDLVGKKVLYLNGNGNEQVEIDATTLTNGIYMVRIRSGASWHQSKVVISK